MSAKKVRRIRAGKPGNERSATQSVWKTRNCARRRAGNSLCKRQGPGPAGLPGCDGPGSQPGYAGRPALG